MWATIPNWVGPFILIVGFLTIGIALLPSGVDHPLPPEVVTATVSLFQWLTAFNAILPVDTLVRVLGFGVLLQVVLRLIIPALAWVIKTITGGGQ